LGVSLDGSEQQNRRYAKLVLDKIKKDYPNEDCVLFLEGVIEDSLANQYFSPSITGFSYLFYNLQKLVRSASNQAGVTILK